MLNKGNKEIIQEEKNNYTKQLGRSL